MGFPNFIRVILRILLADRAAPALMKPLGDRAAEVDGRLHIDDLNDALKIEVPEDEVDRAEALVRRAMEGVFTLDVPLVVDIATGRTLGDTKG